MWVWIRKSCGGSAGWSLSFQGRVVGCFWYKAKARWILLGTGLVGGKWVELLMSEAMLADK